MAAVLTALGLSFLPAHLLMLISIFTGILTGMAVGSIPGIFKAKLNASEVIVAIMLNYICTLFTSWLVSGHVKAQGSTPQTHVSPEGVWFGRLIPQTQLTSSLFLLLAVAFALYIFLWKTSLGFQLWAVGANASAAGTAGIKVQLLLVLSMILSGGLAALGGVWALLRHNCRAGRSHSSGRGMHDASWSIFGSCRLFLYRIRLCRSARIHPCRRGGGLALCPVLH